MPVRQVRSKVDINRFIELEYHVYNGNSCWVPSLKADTTKILSGKSVFSPHIELQAYYFEQDGRTLARVCIFINQRHLKLHQANIAFFGFFEALPNQESAVLKLLDTAAQWAKQKGMSFLVGPINGDALYGNSMKVDSFDKVPMFPLGYAQPYYRQYLTEFGLNEEYKELCYAIDLTKLTESDLVSRSKLLPDGFVIRPMSFDNFHSDHDEMVTVVNAAFADKWYYSSYDLDLSFAYWKALKPLLVRELLQVVEHNGKIVAVLDAFPDYNPAIRVMKGRQDPLALAKFLWKQRAIREGSLMVLAVLPEYTRKGLGPALTASAMLEMKKRGYHKCYYHTVTENNLPSRKVAESFGGMIVSNFMGYRKIL